MTMFALHWRRDTDRPDPDEGDRLPLGLTRLRNDPVLRWTRGPLAVWHFAGDPGFSILEHPAGFVAILVGRLDAFADLVRSVGGQGVVGDDPTDAHVLAAAYEKWGRDCLPHLIGDFVAIIWEPRERILLVARDRVGVAPLYYWESDREVVLAGHLGGVMAHPAVPVVPNEGFIAELLSDNIVSRTETNYRGVWRIPAGHAREFRNGRATTWEWAPPYSVEVAPWSSAEADEEYREVLTTAILDRMRGHGEVGAELSGGLDSSAVAVLAAPHALARDGRPLRSYSLVFPGLDCDESPFVGDVARFAGLQARLIPCGPLDPDRWATDIASTWDLPVPPNLEAWDAIASAAREDGVRTLFTGQGGDQACTPNGLYPRELALRGELAAAARCAQQFSPESGFCQAAVRGIARPLLSYGLRSILPGFMPPQVPSWICTSFAKDVGLLKRITPRDAPPLTPRDARLLGYRCGWTALWFEYANVFYTRGGVTGVHPFFDTRMLQFALNLDESHRLSDGQWRAIQRRSMRGILPVSVVERTTWAEFSALFAEALQHPSVRQQVSEMRIAHERHWVNASAVRGRFECVMADLSAGIIPERQRALWTAIAVERWRAAVGTLRSGML